MTKWLMLLLFLGGCSTTSVVAGKTSNQINIGMTKKDVLNIAGDPFQRSAYIDKIGNSVGELTYKQCSTTRLTGPFTTACTAYTYTSVLLVDNKVSGVSNKESLVESTYHVDIK